MSVSPSGHDHGVDDVDDAVRRGDIDSSDRCAVDLDRTAIDLNVDHLAIYGLGFIDPCYVSGHHLRRVFRASLGRCIFVITEVTSMS